MLPVPPGPYISRLLFALLQGLAQRKAFAFLPQKLGWFIIPVRLAVSPITCTELWGDKCFESRSEFH